MHANDLFATITAQLIDDIETGAAGTWRMNRPGIVGGS